jgi:ANTAR domain/GAF domain
VGRLPSWRAVAVLADLRGCTASPIEHPPSARELDPTFWRATLRVPFELIQGAPPVPVAARFDPVHTLCRPAGERQSMSTEPPHDGTPETGGESGADGPRSPALTRALAAHPIYVTQLMTELDRRVSDEDSSIDLMHRSSKEAVRLLSGVDWAGVTARFAGPAFTAAHTEHRVLIVDEGQYGQGDGPCLQALRTGRPVTMSSEEVGQRWPVLDRAVRTAGVRSFHAQPLHAHQQTVGCLNLYGGKPGTLIPDHDLLAVLTEYLDRGLTDYAATQPDDTATTQLQDMLHARFLINQAVGVLMAVHGIDAGTARDLLDHQATEQNTPLVDTARAVIKQYTATGEPTTE